MTDVFMLDSRLTADHSGVENNIRDNVTEG